MELTWKRHFKKKKSTIKLNVYKRDSSDLKHIQVEHKKDLKKYHLNNTQKNAVTATLLSDKIDFRRKIATMGKFYNNKKVNPPRSYNNYKNLCIL